MKNKGFTLVELLAIIVLLILVFLIIYPSVTNILSKSKETIYDKQINTILTAAYDYSLQNISILPEYDRETYITLGNLKVLGLIDINITDPIKGKKYDDDIVISIKNVGTNYQYQSKNSKLEGNYLYTLKENKNDNIELIPVFEIKGKINNVEGNPLTPYTDHNYIITLELGDKFEDEYSSRTRDDIYLTDQVNRYIINNEKMVNSINTTVPDIYKIYYSVIDDQGYSNFAILNIIIADTKTPKIIFSKKDIVLSKDATQFDFLSDVVCEDTSGFCNIEYSEDIKYGVSGKYIIKYTATDPSGNTTEKERIIRIE